MNKMNHTVLLVIFITVKLLVPLVNGNDIWVEQSPSFTIDYTNNCFLKDGKPFRFVSGSMHYFRVPRSRWKDRMAKMKAAGLNALQTYVEWSSHEVQPGLFYFEGDYDLVQYIKTAQQVGLLVILRPGPYIDAERDMGGLPFWLLGVKRDIKLRSMDPEYMYYVDRWFGKLLPMIWPLLYSNGGPVIAVQVENEYGSYSACDFAYTAYLRDLFIKFLGDNIVLFTTDGYLNLMCGKIDRVFSTVDFGIETNVTHAFHHQRLHQSRGPLVNSEFYPGWLDYWGYPHANVSTESVCETLEEILSMNASVNIYMFHGGTSFGFGSGAGLGRVFKVSPTSYDYDAPLSEAGDPTEKYFSMRKVIGKFLPLPSEPVPGPSVKLALGTVDMKTTWFPLLDFLPYMVKSFKSKYPLSFEDIGQRDGFLMYTTKVDFRPTDPAILNIPGLRDRGYIFVEKQLQGILDRGEKIFTLPIKISRSQNLAIFVENQGRVCFGNGIHDRKGIVDNVTIGSVLLTNWTILPWNPDFMHENTLFEKLLLKHSNKNVNLGLWNNNDKVIYPSVFRGSFVLPEDITDLSFDTFLRLDGWHKGVVYLNNYSLGRYWPVVGPQETLYVPGSFFRLYPSINTITVMEQERSPCEVNPTCSVEFVAKPVINSLTPNSIEMNELDS